MPLFDNPHHTLTHLTRIARDLARDVASEALRGYLEDDLESLAEPESEGLPVPSPNLSAEPG